MSRRRFKVTWNQTIRSAGLVGIAVETFYSVHLHQSPDGGLLVLFGSMVGLPTFLNRDSKDRDIRDNDDSDNPPASRHRREE